MAQIWLTYEELAEFCGCAPAAARLAVVNNQWSRRKSGDGLTRVKLPPAMMRDFISTMALQWQGQRPALPDMGIIDHDDLADRTSSDLRAVLMDMADVVSRQQRTA